MPLPSQCPASVAVAADAPVQQHELASERERHAVRHIERATGGGLDEHAELEHDVTRLGRAGAANADASAAEPSRQRRWKLLSTKHKCAGAICSVRFPLERGALGEPGCV